MAYAAGSPRIRRAGLSRAGLPVAGLALAGLALAGCASVGEPENGELFGSILTTPYQAPEAPLTDTDGEPYSLTDDTDRPLTLVFFGYTHCPDTCLLVMNNITQGLNRLGDDRDDVDMVYVTTDPARDDEAMLRRYLDRFDESYVGLTGELDDLVETGHAFHVFMEKGKRLPTGGYDVEHTTHFFAIDSNNEVPITWSADTTGAELATDLEHLLDS